MKKTEKSEPAANEALKMACLEQAVKAGGNGDQILANAASFYAWMTKEAE